MMKHHYLTVQVVGLNHDEIEMEAKLACNQYFGEQKYQITEIDVEPLLTSTKKPTGKYGAKVTAEVMP